MCAALMLLMPFVVNIGATTGFSLSLLVLVILAFASGTCQGTVFMMAAAFPPQYMGAVMFGTGICGIAVTLLRSATLKIFPADESD